MRMKLILAPLLLCASPAFAQPAAASCRRDRRSQPWPTALANAAQAVSDALLNIPVGDLKAAAEGRRATPDEKRMTVRDLARRDDPDFDRKLHDRSPRRGRWSAEHEGAQRVAARGDAEPAAGATSLERALANLPDPTYPQR